MSQVASPPSSEWITGRQAAGTIGFAPSALQRAAMLGQIRVKIEPGVTPRYHRGDVQRFAQARRSSPEQGAEK